MKVTNLPATSTPPLSNLSLKNQRKKKGKEEINNLLNFLALRKIPSEITVVSPSFTSIFSCFDSNPMVIQILQPIMTGIEYDLDKQNTI